MIKDIYKKTTNIILNNESLNAFLLKSGRMYMLTSSIEHTASTVLVVTSKTGKEKKFMLLERKIRLQI